MFNGATRKPKSGLSAGNTTGALRARRASTTAAYLIDPVGPRPCSSAPALTADREWKTVGARMLKLEHMHYLKMLTSAN